MSPLFARVALLSVGLFSLFGGMLAAADPVPAERRLPADVLAFVRVANVTEFKAQLAKSTYGQLWSDPAMADFRKNVEEEWSKSAAEASEKLGLPVSDLLNLPQGEAAFAVVQPASEGIAVVGFLDVGSGTELLDKALDKLDKQLEEDGAKRSTEEISGVDVTIFEMPAEDDAADDAEAKRFLYFVKDGVAVVSSHKDLVEDVLSRWDGADDDCFADQDVYKFIISRCHEGRTDPSLQWYIDPITSLTAGLNSDPRMAMQSVMLQGYLSPFGLDHLKAIGGTTDLEVSGYDMMSRTYIFAEQPVSGLLKVFTMPSSSQAPPAWVPGDVASYSSFNWDAQSAWNAVEMIADTLMSQKGRFKKEVEKVAKRDPMVHPKTDVIDQLSGAVRLVTGAPQGEDMAQSTLVAVELKSERAISDLLARVTAKAPLAKREFEGVTIYEPKNAPPQMESAAFAVARGHLWFTNKVADLERILRTEKAESPLSEAADYKAVAAKLPAETSMSTFSRPAVQFKAFFEAARSGQFDGLTEGKIDFSKLPEFDAVKKYFSPSGGYIVPDENGALIENMQLAD